MPSNVKVLVDKSATMIRIRLNAGDDDNEPSELLYDILMQFSRMERDDGEYEITDAHRRFATTLCNQMDKAIFSGRA